MNIVQATLNDRQTAFVKRIINGANPAAAAEAAGYAFPVEDGWRLLHLPIVSAAIQRGVVIKMQSEDAPAARKVIRELMLSDKTPARVRLDAGRTLLDRAGFIAPAASREGARQSKELHEMTADELRAKIAELEREVSERAKPIVIDAKSLANDTQAVDMLS